MTSAGPSFFPEPFGGAHRDPAKAAELLAKSLKKNLDKLSKLSEEELVAQRYAKFRAIGTFLESAGK